MLHLQQTAGNAAVQRLLVQRDAVAETTRDERIVAAQAGGDWAGVAKILLGADEKWMVRKLHNFGADQLRYLDDAVRRMGVKNSRLRIFIHAGLMQLGANDDTAAPGAGYGEIKIEATPKDGLLRRNGNNKSASYKVKVSFQPNAGAVDAEEIAFIQMAKVVSTTEGTVDPAGDLDWNNEGANGSDRQTADHARVDRLPGKDYGWIGLDDDGTPSGGRLHPWHRGGRDAAWMTDTPSRDTPNVTFSFETAAVCRKGPDRGKVYATVQWGFTIDGSMKVIPKNEKYFNKESSEFDLAVAFWNAEAGQEDSTQHELPTLH